MLGLSGFYINSRGSSLSSSAVTSRASSPSPSQPWDAQQQQQQRSKSTVFHQRAGSFPTTDIMDAPNPGTTMSANLLHHNSNNPTSTQATDMRRSESASSLRSSNSTTVEDSSLTKSAYKKSSRLMMKRPTTTTTTNKHPAPPQRQFSRSNELERGLLDVYLTLHLSIEEAAFFKSETIPNTVNPSFRALDSSQWTSSWYDGVQTEIVIRLWARHSFPESATAVRSDDQYAEHDHPTKSRRPSQPTEEYQLLLEWQVDLNTLAFIGKTVNIVKKWCFSFFLFIHHMSRCFFLLLFCLLYYTQKIC